MGPEHSDSATHRLGRLMHQLRGVVGPSPEDLVGIDLPRHQMRALFIVARHGPLSVGALAHATDATLASASSLSDRLVKSGHIRRDEDPDDRRRVLLVVTPKGEATTEQVASRFHERFDRVVEAMSPEGRAALEAGLIDLVRAADDLGLHADHGSHGGGG